jgi:peptide deformylase
MAVRQVLKMGDPKLYLPSEPVGDFNTPELASIIEDMFDTMAEYNGVGLAAPQIGINKRIIIFGLEANSRYPDVEPVPQTILINPDISPVGDALVEVWEGCLSIPGMRGLVVRPASVEYSGFTPAGEKIERSVDGFHARVVQHECDHLDGILYPQRIKDMRQFGFEEAFIMKEQESAEY